MSVRDSPPPEPSDSDTVGWLASDSGADPDRSGDVPARDAARQLARVARRFETRYVRRGVLGHGGMGEVSLQHDRIIGRDVAVKVAHTGDRQLSRRARGRFLREARVQGQLEHPSIVPVYDLATREDGSLYSSMKTVRRRSLSEILSGLRDDDPQIRERYTRRRLLTALSAVCLAVDYAHARAASSTETASPCARCCRGA